jgi:hypothetical protein
LATPPGSRRTEQVVFTWTPQTTINVALLISLVGLLATLVLIAWRPRRPVAGGTGATVADAPPVFGGRQPELGRAGLGLYGLAVVASLFVSFWLIPVALLAVFAWRTRPAFGTRLAQASRDAVRARGSVHHLGYSPELGTRHFVARPGAYANSSSGPGSFWLLVILGSSSFGVPTHRPPPIPMVPRDAVA